MSAEPTELWPWLALAGLGFFHGINPAMGWLFAVALGLHRRSFRTVLLSLVPIALGHAMAIALVLVAALALGLVSDHVIAGRVAAVAPSGGKADIAALRICANTRRSSLRSPRRWTKPFDQEIEEDLDLRGSLSAR